MVWSAIELREIRVFLALAEELHFGRTAERVHVTTSRVSQTVRDLERKLGGQLVRRTSRRVELTEFGQQFRAEVGVAYDQLTGVLERTAAPRGDQRPLRLGLFADPTAPEITQMVKAFEARHPEAPVQVSETHFDDLFGPLHRGELDVMVSWLPHGQRGLVRGPIVTSQPRVLAVGPEHPLAQRAGISIEDVADYAVMMWDTVPREFREMWTPSKTPSGRPIRHELFSERSRGDRARMTSELMHLVATGKIVHPTVPSFARYFGHPDIVYVPITDLPPLRSGLIWRRGNTDPRCREFVRIAREVLGGTARPRRTGAETPNPSSRGASRAAT
jgi:DNA-binding transcriptional LysR family regulator